MTTRNRARTPRRVKDWASVDFENEGLAANAAEISDVLATYYSDRGVTSIPGITVMRIIGMMTCQSNVISGNLDLHFGIRVANSGVSATTFPTPYRDPANWLWTERVLDKNFLSNSLSVGVTNRHRFEVDVGSRRRLRSVEDRLFFYGFNSDATSIASYSYHLRILLALP